MNILVITDSSWDNQNSLGNTLSNWFEGWSDCKFSCMTFRSEVPDNNVCSEYFVVSPVDVAKHIFTPWRIGYRYTSENLPAKSVSIEGNAVGSKGLKRRLILSAMDCLYQLPFWRNRKYKSFVQSVDPDIVFLFATSVAFVYQSVKYIKAHTDAKVVISAEDDVYGVVSEAKNLMAYKCRKRYDYMFKVADRLYGASQQMCDAYGEIFQREFKPIYKGCEFSRLKQTVNAPIEIVYAGNLLFGRLNTLAAIASVLRSINKDELKVRLTIYSGTKVDDDILQINDGRSSVFAGRKSFEEIKGILNAADITLHVESFEPERKKIVRYSFSTKIIDCLQSGNTMMVVGPEGIASVEYPRTIPGAIVVDDIEFLYPVLSDIIKNPETLIVRAKQIYAHAVANHDVNRVRESLQRDFKALIN